MSNVRRCLGCSATYPADGHACPDCDSHAGEVEVQEEQADLAKPKPPRKRKT
jgi:hypothetical protein